MTDRLKEIKDRWAGPSFNVTFPEDVQNDLAWLAEQLADSLALIAEKDREIERLRRLLTALDVPTGTIR